MLRLLVLVATFAACTVLIAVLTPSWAQTGCRQYEIRTFSAADLAGAGNRLEPGWEPFLATSTGVYGRRCI